MRELYPSSKGSSLKVYMSYHQLAEIFHVLAFRGFKVPLEDAMAIIERIIEDSSIVKVPTTADTEGGP